VLDRYRRARGLPLQRACGMIAAIR